jgi:hypothetical protein
LIVTPSNVPLLLTTSPVALLVATTVPLYMVPPFRSALLTMAKEALVRFSVPPLTVKLPTTTLPETTGVPLEITALSLLPGTPAGAQLVGLDQLLATEPNQLYVLARTSPAEIARVTSIK